MKRLSGASAHTNNGRSPILYKDLKEKKSVSAIVPILDEEKTLANIINILINNPLIDEVICVNDGSTDGTKDILTSYKNTIHVVNLKKNRGKGHALVKGIKKAKSEIVAFFDADLINLTDKHIVRFLKPILTEKARAVLGYPTGCPPKYRYIVFKSITGQRVYYKKDLLPHLKYMTKTRYGVETYLNSIYKKSETKKMPLVNLAHLYKHQKHSPRKATKESIRWVTEVTREMGKRKASVFKQWTVAKLKRVKPLFVSS